MEADEYGASHAGHVRDRHIRGCGVDGDTQANGNTPSGSLDKEQADMLTQKPVRLGPSAFKKGHPMTNDTGGPAFPKVVRSDWTEIDDGMSLRQYAAIALRVPNSGTDWLDDMIREARREDCAAKAMQAMVSNLEPSNPDGITPEMVAENAYIMADAMLAARSEKEGE